MAATQWQDDTAMIGGCGKTLTRMRFQQDRDLALKNLNPAMVTNFWQTECLEETGFSDDPMVACTVSQIC